MERAYLETIRDLKIAISYTDWWRFKRINFLNKQILFYEKKLKELEDEK